jgi:RNA-directed DNA polymerase
MALFRWIADLVLGPPKRDVSRLEGDDVDVLEETVDLSGGPLKPGHHRRALRDRRLLPKRKPSGLSPLKKKPIMSGQESARLFSRTHRTANRGVRDLLPDLDQLSRFHLPHWKNEEELAEGLGLSVSQLQHYSIHRFQDRVSHYITFRVPKQKGGERLIMAPKTRLKALQRKVLEQILNRLPAPTHAHGFVKGRSVKTGAQIHVGKKVVVKLDLADFFGSVTFQRVRGLFIALGYGYPVATTLAVLTTECERQRVSQQGRIFHVPVGERHCVQGAPTSPALCNQIARKMDNRLHGLAQKLGFSFTRYADDLTFSGDDSDQVKSLLRLAQKIIVDEGFQLRQDKTRILRQGGHQQVTGVTVNQTLGLSRKTRRQLRAFLHRLQKADTPDPQELAQARGKLAYLAMLNPTQAEALKTRYPLFQ